MKRAIIILLVCITTQSINAQSLKGNLFAGGSLHYLFNSTKYNDNKFPEFSFSVNPRIGYFLTDNFSAGLSGHFYQAKYNYDLENSEYDSESSSPGIGLFAGYHRNISTNLFFFGEMGFDYTTSKSITDDIASSKNRNFLTHLEAGLTYFISPHWAFDASTSLLSYRISYSKDKYTDEKRTITNFTMSPMLSTVYLGVNYHF